MLKANTTLKELDVSNSAKESYSKGGPSFSEELADGVKNNGALAKLDIRNNGIPDDQQANLKGICASKSIDFML